MRCCWFFGGSASTDISTLSLHDALPIYGPPGPYGQQAPYPAPPPPTPRSEEHTSELQSLRHLVCRLLLEKKKTTMPPPERPKKSRPPPRNCLTGHSCTKSTRRARAIAST